MQNFFKKYKLPSENFLESTNLLRRLCRNSGVDLYDINHKMNWRTNFLLYSGVTYFILIFYTIFNNADEDWTVILSCAATLGSGIQGQFKLIDLLFKKKEMAKTYQLIIDLYKENEKLGNGYRKALEDVANKTGLILYPMIVLYAAGCIGMLFLPYSSYLLTGNHELIIQFHIPGLDINTNVGYFSTMAIQTILLIYYANSLYCGDASAMMFLMQVKLFSNVFEAKIECINTMIENPEDSKKPEVSEALNDLIKWHQLYSRYTTSINHLFYNVITVQIVSGFISTLLCIYLLLAGGWVGVYSYVVIAFTSIYIYCIMGTQNEIANEDFELHMYNLHWYNLTVPQQKMVIQIIMKTQSPETIDIAGFMPLSVSTALKLTKTLYSIAMFMLEFLVK